MSISLKIGLCIFVSALGLSLASPVCAKENNEKEDRVRAFFTEVSDKAGSRPGLLRTFLHRGRAAIGSGTLSAINGTTLTVTGKDGKAYTVLTDDKTQFRRRFWGKGSLSEMQVGDTLNIIGQWTDDAKTTIQAQLVRDTSIQKRFGVFFGTVQSVSGNGFVIQTVQRGRLTVIISSSTKLVNRKGDTIMQADIAVGHKVRTRGLWDNESGTLTETAEVKDFHLPVQPTPTPTP